MSNPGPGLEADYSGLPHGNLDWETRQKIALGQLHDYGEHLNYAGFYQTCSVHGKAKPVFACAHCVRQDHEHPVGMSCYELGYYLCRECEGLVERRKFDYQKELKLACELCIQDEGIRISQINPGLIRNLRKR